MADPMSVVGLVVGVISFGLDLCGGISTYLDRLNARPDDIQRAKASVSTMRVLLAKIDSIASGLPDKRIIDPSVLECESRIKDLGRIVTELTGEETGGSSLRFRVKEKSKKLMYPFRREALQQLESSLATVNSSLQTALMVFNLEQTVQIGRAAQQMSQDLSQLVARLTVQDATFSAATSPATSKTQGALRGLLSKPSYFKEVADQQRYSLSSYDQAAKQKPEVSLTMGDCQCHQTGSSVRSQRTWGSWAFSQETRFALRYTGLGRLMGVALQMSLTITNGAGGCAISPFLCYSPVVDERTSPAFRVLDFAARLIPTYRSLYYPPIISGETGATCAEIIRGCMDSLLVLYSKGLASPRDIDSQGRSAMHVLVGILHAMCFVCGGHNQEFRYRVSRESIRGLIQYGVPAMTHNSMGETPVAIMLRHFDQRLLEDSASALIAQSPDTPISLAPVDSTGIWWMNWAEFFISSPLTSEACGNGPLSHAVINNDHLAIANILAKDSARSYLEESNWFRQTPLHLSIDKPETLQILIQGGFDTKLDVADSEGIRPVEYAAVKARRNVDALDSLRILLQSGCAVHPNTIPSFNRDFPGDIDQGVHNTFWDALRHRRDSLKLLGLKHLPRSLALDLGLFDERILDYHAASCFEALENLGIEVPKALDPRVPASVKVPGHVEAWCYNTGLPVIRAVLDGLWDRGFRDMDQLDKDGVPPFMTDVFSLGNLDYCYWFVEHGADIWTPLCQRQCSNPRESDDIRTPAHFLLAKIGRWFRPTRFANQDSVYGDSYDDGSYQSAPAITAFCSRYDPRDSCVCPCTENGCTPFDYFFKWIGNEDYYPRPQPPEWIASSLLDSVQDLQINMLGGNGSKAIRMLTFRALQLPHTCCGIPLTKGYWCEGTALLPEDANEINEARAESLDVFEALVEDLTRRYERDDGDGEPFGVAKADEFWLDCWVPGVQRVLAELESRDLTQEEKEAAEEIGVVWYGPETETPRDPDDGVTMEAFQDMLRAITRDI
ncbi:hypothetical protein MCOR04_008184 [Pyricularia oryzae]|nr:hypothetical protein MCOR17_007439 [Pyricularia oryzae]KAI6570120.1 hypothetical protein MCOR04_008184 [Pyricularia oryzae]